MITGDALKFFADSKYAGRLLALLVAQQVVVASSTVWLTKTAAAAVAGRSFAGYGLLYGISLVLPYLPGILSVTCLHLWELDLQKNFVDRFVGANQGHIAAWRNQDERSERVALLSKEGPQVIQDSTKFAYELLAASLNICMNMAVIALVIHPIFTAGYAVSFALCAFLIWTTRGRNEALAIKAQESSLRFTGVMLRIWDNVLLGNEFSLREWRKNSDHAFSAARLDRLGSVGYTQVMLGSATALAMLPVAAAVVWHLADNSGRLEQTSAMLVTLPRLFMMLTMAFNLLALSFAWVAHLARVRAVLSSLNAPGTRGDLASQIDFGGITVESGNGAAAATSLGALKELLQKPGRYTIRGQNGAGKTALLLKLKEEFAGRASYIPASHDLDVAGLTRDLSTGQRARGTLSELLRSDASPVILLDEWDANLDELNRGELSEKIRAESRERVIVEVVHSKEVAGRPLSR